VLPRGFAIDRAAVEKVSKTCLSDRIVAGRLSCGLEHMTDHEFNATRNLPTSLS
jgi:hypothetical protein